MVHNLSSDYIKIWNSNNYIIDLCVKQLIDDLKINKSYAKYKKTRRGVRAGKNKTRNIKTIVSNRNINYSNSKNKNTLCTRPWKCIF